METHLRGEAEEKGGRAVRDLGLRDMSIRGEQRGRSSWSLEKEQVHNSLIAFEKFKSAKWFSNLTKSNIC